MKPPPDLVDFKQQQQQHQPQPDAPPARPDRPTKSAVDDAGSRRAQQSREQSRSKHPDEAFLSRFDVKGSLGQGGFGEVLACWDNKLQRRVAVKVVRAAGGARYAWSAQLSLPSSRALLRPCRCAAVSSRRVRMLYLTFMVVRLVRLQRGRGSDTFF